MVGCLTLEFSCKVAGLERCCGIEAVCGLVSSNDSLGGRMQSLGLDRPPRIHLLKARLREGPEKVHISLRRLEVSNVYKAEGGKLYFDRLQDALIGCSSRPDQAGDRQAHTSIIRWIQKHRCDRSE
jgi:hypothetical protein